jgi:hypothetical protein
VTIEVVVTGLLEEKGVEGISEDLGKVITSLQLLLTEIVEYRMDRQSSAGFSAYVLHTGPQESAIAAYILAYGARKCI